MDKAHIIMGFHWVTYCLVHSFLANNYIKQLFTNYLKVGRNFYRFLYNVVAVVYLGWLVLLHFRLQSPAIFPSTVFSESLAGILVLTGIGIMLLCIRKYFNQLSGISAKIQEPELYTGGLHRFVRHPLYLGTFIFLTGVSIFWPLLKNFVASFILIGYTLVGTLWEEKKLLHQFGASYKAYQDKVPMIIPRFRLHRKKTNSGTGTLIN
jgi:protein-S-isoprenylcysteine O-methyltransferase Ste14